MQFTYFSGDQVPGTDATIKVLMDLKDFDLFVT
jgi:hypothetical protein